MRNVLFVTLLLLLQSVSAEECRQTDTMLSMDLEIIEAKKNKALVAVFPGTPLYVQKDDSLCAPASDLEQLYSGSPAYAGVRALPQGDLWITEKAEGDIYLTLTLDVSHSAMIKGKKLSELGKSCKDFVLELESQNLSVHQDHMSLKLAPSAMKQESVCGKGQGVAKSVPLQLNVYVYSDAISKPPKEKEEGGLIFKNPQLEKESNKKKRLKKI